MPQERSTSGCGTLQAPLGPSEARILATGVPRLPGADQPEEPRFGSARHGHRGALGRAVFDRLFGSIEYPARSAKLIARLAGRGALVYVARSKSTWLALYLNHVLSRTGLPLAHYISGIDMSLRDDPGWVSKWLRRRLRTAFGCGDDVYGGASGDRSADAFAQGVLRGEAALLFLRSARSALRTAPQPKHDFHALVAAQRLSSRSVFLVPHAVVDPMKGGASRRNRRLPTVPLSRRFRVRTGEPIDLRTLIAEHPGDCDETLALRVRRELERRIAAEERLIAGPELPRTGALERRLLRSPHVKEAVRAQARRTGKQPKHLEALAASYAKDIAAHYSPRVTSLFAAGMRRVFGLIYDSIVVDEIGFSRVVEASRSGPVVFCPTHKSHADYLVLSLVFWNRGLTPPHIAAGENLSFFPLGALFRGSGAFFVRRSFRYDFVYAAVLRAYVIDLLRRGVSLELFLEGTRSRTGKTMRPKLGLASMATDAWRFGSHDIHFVPVSVDYDRVIEVSSYARELAGAEKRSESMAGLLGAIRVLGSRYGSVRLQFGDPISLAALARTRGLPRDPSPKHDGVWRAEVEKLCSHILRRAAEMSLVTPAAIAATALLGRGETIRESAFLDRCRGIVEYLQGAGTRLAETLLDRTTQLSTLLEATTRFVEDGAVAVEVPTRVGGQRLYRVLGEHRIALDFYKNSAMTHVAGAAIVCRALARNGGEATHPDLSDAGRFLLGPSGASSPTVTTKVILRRDSTSS